MSNVIDRVQKMPSIPSSVYVLARNSLLGQPLEGYYEPWTPIFLYGFFGSLLLGIIWIAQPNSPFAIPGIVSLLFSLLCLVVLLNQLYELKTRLYLCEQGFMMLKRSKRILVHWSSVQDMRRHSYPVRGFLSKKTHTAIVYIVERQDGRKYPFSPAYGPIIEQAFVTNRFPAMQVAFEAGEMLDFGAIRINQNELRLRQHLFAFDSKDSTSDGDDKIILRDSIGAIYQSYSDESITIVRTHQYAISVPLQVIHNAPLLLHLVNYYEYGASLPMYDEEWFDEDI